MREKRASYDVVVVGAGIVGLAAARALLARDPSVQICVLERHDRVAAGQSGHNSGVIHSGIYYRPGSRKAALCRRGRSLLLDYCAGEGIAHRICGKILLATDELEAARLDALLERAQANGLVGVERLDPAAIREVEPAATGVAALRVPEAGVVDFADVAGALADELAGRGVRFRFGEPLLGAEGVADGVRVRTRTGWLDAGRLLACAGLWADDVARRAGLEQAARILPFRGEYWVLDEAGAALVKNLIYPVPDPELPFLGVHLTRDVHGTVDAGPNAVLALAREGYTRRQVDLAHLAGLMAWPATWRLVWRQRRHVAGEMLRSMSRRETARRLRRMVPALREENLRAGPAGVRAQLVDPDGSLVDDFRFARGKAMLHVLNAPSPAATASLAIGEHLADELLAL